MTGFDLAAKLGFEHRFMLVIGLLLSFERLARLGLPLGQDRRLLLKLFVRHFDEGSLWLGL